MQNKITALLKLKQIGNFFQIFATEISHFRIVGGAIRNALLELPIKDIDFCTDYSPDALISLCIKKNISYKTTGLKYGTITIIINKTPYEITSLRDDIETDGRHTKVIYSTDYITDSKRRDFSINALYLDFTGKLYDFHDGIGDIKNKRLKFIGDARKRITEDYLRILRFFRFYAELPEFILDTNSLTATTELKSLITKLSPERVRQELIKTLQGQNYYKALKVLSKCHIYDPFFKLNKTSLETFEKYDIVNNIPPEYQISLSYIVITSNNILVTEKENKTSKQLLNNKNAALEKLKSNLKLSNKEIDNIKYITQNHTQLPPLDIATTEIQKLLFFSDKEKLKFLYKYQIFISSKSCNKYQHFIQNINRLVIPKLPINGDDLLRTGIKEGKNMGNLLQKLQQKWLDSDFTLNKTELLSYTREFVN